MTPTTDHGGSDRDAAGTGHASPTVANGSDRDAGPDHDAIGRATPAMTGRPASTDTDRRTGRPRPAYPSRTAHEPTTVESRSLTGATVLAAIPPALVAAATWPAAAAAVLAAVVAVTVARRTAPAIARRYAGSRTTVRVPGANLQVEVAVSDPGTPRST